MAWTLASLAAWCMLHGYLVARGGQTIGKRLLSIRVVAIEDDRPVGLARYFLRRELPLWALWLLLTPASQLGPRVLDISLAVWVYLLGSILDVLFIYRHDRRCLHDFIAATRVVRA